MFETSHFHPMLVHFPIALVVFGFIADAASLVFQKETWLSKTAFYLLVTGTLAAIVTWLSGQLFTAEMTGVAGNVRETHETFALITVGLLVITSILRTIIETKKINISGLKWVAFLLYALATLSVTVTGFYGGTLVYNYMMPL